MLNKALPITVVALCFLTVLAALPQAQAQDSSGLIPEDYFDFIFPGDIQISPDGSKALFVKTWVNEDGTGRHTRIYQISDQDEVSAFTQGTSDSSPKWSPDGSSIAFIRPVEDNAQVFTMPANGGEAKQVTYVENGISAFQWMPNGNQLLLTLRVDADAKKKDANQEKEASAQRAEPDMVVVQNALYLANGSGYLSNKRSHLFLFDIESKKLGQLTHGDDWNVNAPRVSPDGTKIYFHANKTGLEYEGNNNSDIFQLDIETEAITSLTSHAGAQFNVNPAKAGSSLVYLHREDTYAQAELLLRKSDSTTVNLTAEFDRDAAFSHWSADGKSLFFTTNDKGANRLFVTDIEDVKVKAVLPDDKTIRHLAVAENKDVLLFTMESATLLPEIYRLNLNDKALTQLTTFNTALLNKKALSPADDEWFTNNEGMHVHGFIHKPIGFTNDASYPLILNIKGGPGGMWGHQWFHENQMYAAKGYAVAYVNYRGSSGYGLAHSQAVRLDYGGADYQDNIQFLEHILAQHPWVDQKRLYVTGGSHGGFLTNWITTKTDRFKAAVTQRSVSSWISEAGTQEFTPYQMTKEFGGNLWTNFDYYWNRSPLKYANNVTTPTLIIHSDQDMITPIGQGQEWFYALKANNVPVEMVIFKGETHSLSRSGTPVSLVERLRRIINWFDRH
ncbi:S9 family peptidase [Alteromonas sediminis]|uniref:S9 family peptidase n=1 Tax=Alteromonas sediminis TaxID=2259342 RepID=A0A3N5XYW4_9ALTE|nr:S9 family peptidase [Alteromonas sediminis]RPJ65850.1 S9 family peptidase [Alteromonas sediminis]